MSLLFMIGRLSMQEVYATRPGIEHDVEHRMDPPPLQFPTFREFTPFDDLINRDCPPEMSFPASSQPHRCQCGFVHPEPFNPLFDWKETEERPYWLQSAELEKYKKEYKNFMEEIPRESGNKK